MYSPALIIATAKIEGLLAEAASNRLAAQAKKARTGRRFGGVIAGLRSLLPDSVAGPTALPKLSDYPYRS